MPCNDGGQREDREGAMLDRLNIVTRLLCELCSKAVKAGVENDIFSPEMAKWWEEHQAKDRARFRQEQEQERQDRLRARAINKLTTAEQKALGLPHQGARKSRKPRK